MGRKLRGEQLISLEFGKQIFGDQDRSLLLYGPYKSSLMTRGVLSCELNIE